MNESGSVLWEEVGSGEVVAEIDAAGSGERPVVRSSEVRKLIHGARDVFGVLDGDQVPVSGGTEAIPDQPDHVSVAILDPVEIPGEGNRGGDDGLAQWTIDERIGTVGGGWIGGLHLHAGEDGALERIRTGVEAVVETRPVRAQDAPIVGSASQVFDPKEAVVLSDVATRCPGFPQSHPGKLELVRGVVLRCTVSGRAFDHGEPDVDLPADSNRAVLAVVGGAVGQADGGGEAAGSGRREDQDRVARVTGVGAGRHLETGRSTVAGEGRPIDGKARW